MRRCPGSTSSASLETLKDLRCFFVRNGQFVFLTDIFTHTFIAPERTGLRPTDEEEVAVLRLMAQIDKKPYTHQQHSLSNVLPSKLAYYGFYNDRTPDGFALFQLTEKNTNLHRGNRSTRITPRCSPSYPAGPPTTAVRSPTPTNATIPRTPRSCP